MAPNHRLANVLTAWAEQGHTQKEFAVLTELAPSGVNRMFTGDQHPEVDTFGRILARVSPVYPQFAVDLLEAYLWDHVPSGASYDGHNWAELVRIIVQNHSPRLKEDGPVDKFEMLLDRFNHEARTKKHVRALVENLMKWTEAGRDSH